MVFRVTSVFQRSSLSMYMAMQLYVLLILFLSFCGTLGSQQKSLKVELDGTQHDIYIDGEKWFRDSGVLRVRHLGNTWSTERVDALGYKNEYPLSKSSSEQISGSDSIGDYTGVRDTWIPDPSVPKVSSPTFATSILTYHNVPVVSFDIEYLSELSNSFSEADEIKTVSTFPSFVVEEKPFVERGWMTWSGNMASTPRFGKWGVDPVYGDVDGGFPLAVFDSEMQTAVVISPLTSFMTATQTSFWSNSTGVNRTMVTFGPFSSIETVPTDYRYRTLMVAASNVTSAMKLYGEILMKHYGKSHSFRKSDFTINNLGYWTDNGACYYYYNGSYSNYDDLLVAVKKDADTNELPYQYIQLDSWWYYQDPVSLGVRNWTAMPNIFPHGIESMQKKTRWPVVAHNRYWAPYPDYVNLTRVGRKYDWVFDQNSSLPDDYKFWQDLIGSSKEQWGLATYEQDWLYVQFGMVKKFKTDIELGERWLKHMAEAAKSNEVTIQYCMAWPRHVLQSVMNEAVTQIRVSNDYQPDNEQWKVGDSTILSHFIGLAVFKDDFRTSTDQPLCRNYWHTDEKYPVLETYVAALTGGPVGPSDMMGKADKGLVMATCMKTGLLLKPTYPTMSLDSTFVRRALNKAGPQGQLNAAYTQIYDYAWYYVMAAELTADYPLTAAELPPTPTTFPATYLDAVAFQYDYASGQVQKVEQFTEKSVMTIPACGKSDFQYYAIAPRFANINMYLFGELDKFVPVSEQRFVDFNQAQDEVYFRMAGDPGETVHVTVYDGSQAKRIDCTIRTDYYAELIINQQGSAKCF